MNDKLTTILAELRRRFEVLYGTRMVQMMLFGSQARGDAEPGSDIDVLVVLRDEVSPCEEIARTIEDVADVSLHHNEVVPLCVRFGRAVRARMQPSFAQYSPRRCADMMPEQADLLRQAHDSLAAAKILDAQDYHGFAASRAYSTMFYITDAFLLGQGLAFQGIVPCMRPSESTLSRPVSCLPSFIGI